MQNLSLTLEQRLDALVSIMTFNERVEIMKAHAHGGCARKYTSYPPLLFDLSSRFLSDRLLSLSF